MSTGSTSGETQPEPSQPPHVDHGLPPARAHWPEGLLDVLRSFAQGDVVAEPPLFYWADPSTPVWARTHAYIEGSSGPEIVEMDAGSRPRYGVITTQTCDIAEEDADNPIRPWVQISPVYERSDLDGGVRRLLRAKAGPSHLLHLPGLVDGFWVADFRIEVPVEKGWLGTTTRLDGFGDEQHQRLVGQRVALLRQRPAFGAPFVEGVQRPLVTALRQLRATDRDMFDRLHAAVPDVAVDLDSLLDPKVVRLVLLTSEHLSDEIWGWFSNWWDETVPLAHAFDVTLLGLEQKSLDVMTAREYRAMTVVPLDRLSPH